MGVYYLFGLCFALFSFPSLAFSASTYFPSEYYDYDNTSKRLKFNSASVVTPNGVSVSSASSGNVVKNPAGLFQSATGKLDIKPPVGNLNLNTRFTGGFQVSKSALRTGAKAFIRAAPFVGTGLLAVEGLVLLAALYDWEIIDGQVYAVSGQSWSPDNADIVMGWDGTPPEGSFPNRLNRNVNVISDWVFSSGPAPHWSTFSVGQVVACSELSYSIKELSCLIVANGYYDDRYNYNRERYRVAYVPSHYEDLDDGDVSPYFVGLRQSQLEFDSSALSNPPGVAYYRSYDGTGELEPVSLAAIDAAIDADYEPEPDDWDEIIPYVVGAAGVAGIEIVDVEDVDSLDVPPVITTTTSGESTIVEELSPSYVFELAPAIPATNTSVGSRASVAVRYGETVQAYENGVPLPSESTSVLYPPFSTTFPESGSSAETSPFTLPGFCDWASFLCSWIDWTQEPLDDDLDLSQIITDQDFDHSYNISFGNSSCPEPILLNIAFLNKNIELSYEPVCDLAAYAKPLVLISAYIFAIYIGLGVVRNG